MDQIRQTPTSCEHNAASVKNVFALSLLRRNLIDGTWAFMSLGNTTAGKKACSHSSTGSSPSQPFMWRTAAWDERRALETCCGDYSATHLLWGIWLGSSAVVLVVAVEGREVTMNNRLDLSQLALRELDTSETSNKDQFVNHSIGAQTFTNSERGEAKRTSKNDRLTSSSRSSAPD